MLKGFHQAVSPFSPYVKLYIAAVVLLLLVALQSPSSAQVLYGALTGNVVDPNGAAVAGAQIEAREANTGTVQQATTDGNGIYRFVTLLPGTYTVTVTAPGFAKQVTEKVGIAVNAVRRLDVTLILAKVSESVTVIAEAQALQTEKSDVHTNLTAAQIQSLPNISSEGKSFQSLYRIIPGASLPFENNSAAGNPQRAMTTNVNGQSSQGNNTRIDGVQDAYPWLPNNIAYVPPVGAIETVNVTTNSFDAEQGNAGGASVNVQIKSGTNQYHGEVHELFTDNALWAYNYFVPSTTRKPLNVFNQFGGSVGGPIRKDKLFFFADWESTRQNQAPNGGNPQTVPAGGLAYNTAKSAGFFDFRGITDSKGNPVNFYDPRTGNADGTGRSIIACDGVQNELCFTDADPAAAQMASLIPAPNASGTTNNFLVQETGFFHRDSIDGKVNYVPNQKTTVFGRYTYSQSYIFDPPALGVADGNATLGGQLGNAHSRIQLVGIGGTYTFSPNLLLDFNGGFTRQRINAESTDISQNYGTDVLKIPGTNADGVNGDPALYGGKPAFQFNTFSNLGNPNTGNPFLFRDNQYVGNTNLSWIRGRHQLRFGIEYNHTQMNHFQPQGGNFQTARGSFRFTGAGTQLAACTGGPPKETCKVDPTTFTNAQFQSYADFLLGLPDEVGKAIQNTNPNALRWSQWAWYARDQWQLNPKLTFNYGLRWEYYPMGYSDIGGLRVLDPSTMNVLVGGGNSGIPVDNGVDVGHGLFLPRLGMAYRPWDKMVIRAGYGISGDNNNWRFLRNAFPAVTISDFVGANYAPANGSGLAPAGSLTGFNAVNNYSYLPTGVTIIPINGGAAPGKYPLPNGVGSTTIPRDFRRGYINSFNFTIEQDIAGFVASLGYVGSRGIRPLTNMNINAAPGGGGQNGRVLSAKFAPSHWPDINQLTPFGNNYYDSMQAKLTRHFAGGSQIGAVYTWSKTIDYEDNEEINALLFPYSAYLPFNRALAGFDRTHNFQFYGLYDLPFGRGKKWASEGIASALAGGWQLNWVMSVMSGTPFTITDSGSGATAFNAPGNTQTVNIVGPVHILNNQPSSKAKCSSLSCSYFDPKAFKSVTTAGQLGDSGRNFIRGPGFFNLDMSVHRDFRITERFTFQFEANAFSVTNTPHFNNPNTNISGANFGAVTSTIVTTNAGLGGSGGQRQWWFGGKLIF